SRIKRSRLVRGLRRSSRWSRFALIKPQTHLASTESIRTVPTSFSPSKTSTPISKDPKAAEDLSERNKLMIEKQVKTSRSQSSVNTTKEVYVTEIPIEIKGALNGLPWCTTIRLRVKHDANEKPTFIPNQRKIS
uniref:Ribosomal_L6 domain-containing protein n=1 Tax=Elaeophora elaphi TaxID=1147741 RepID=A0A0R3S3B4_9BILA